MQITKGKINSAQKVVIYGPEGIGKSTFASRFPNPVFIDTEGSTKHMDVARTQKPGSWTMLLEQVRYFRDNPDQYETLVIDTADWAERLCTEHICSKSQKSGIEDFGYGKGYTYLEEEFGRLLNLLEEVVEKGMNVVVTAHAYMRKFEQPDELGAYDRWELKLEKKTAPLLKEWSDILLFANYKTFVVNVDGQGAQKGVNKAQGGKRVMYTSHHPCWDAKNRHDLIQELPFDYAEISRCIPSKSGIQASQKPQSQPVKETPRQTPPPEVEAAQHNEEIHQEVPCEKDILHGKMNPPEPERGIPKPLAELMAANGVTIEEIQKAVAKRGYYPTDTPIENYDPSFVSGVLVGAWQAVFQMIKDIRLDSGMFIPVPEGDSEEMPFN